MSAPSSVALLALIAASLGASAPGQSVREVMRIDFPSRPVLAAAWADDGSLFATLSEGGLVLVRDGRSGDLDCVGRQLEKDDLPSSDRIELAVDGKRGLVAVRGPRGWTELDLANWDQRLVSPGRWRAAPEIPGGREGFAERVREWSGTTGRIVVAPQQERAVIIDAHGRARLWWFDPLRRAHGRPLEDRATRVEHVILSGNGAWIFVDTDVAPGVFERVDDRSMTRDASAAGIGATSLVAKFGRGSHFAIVGDGSVCVFDPERGEVVRETRTESAERLWWSDWLCTPQDRALALELALQAKNRWRLESADGVTTAAEPDPLLSYWLHVALAPNGTRVATACDDDGLPRLNLYAATQPLLPIYSVRLPLLAHPLYMSDFPSPVTSLSFIADENELLSSGSSFLARIDAATGAVLAQGETDASGGCHQVAADAVIAVGSRGWRLHGWPTLETVHEQYGEDVFEDGFFGYLDAYSCAPSARRFAVAGWGRVVVYEVVPRGGER